MKKVKKNRGITTLKDKYGRMFTTPWLIGIILFYLLPLAQSVVYSFADVKIKLGGMDISLVGLKNYKNILFVNPNYTGWLRSTVTSFLYSLPIILLLSLVLALILNQNFRGRLFFRALYFLPVIIATGPVISWLFRTTGSDLTNMGVSKSYTAGMLSVDDIVTKLQIDGKAAEYMTSTISKIFDLIWSCGIQTVLFLAGLQSIPGSLYGASRVEGATKWEEFWFITFPMLSRVTLLVSIFTMVELIISTRGIIIQQTYNMRCGGIYDRSSAMLWFYFLIFGGMMAVIILLYKNTLMRRWE